MSFSRYERYKNSAVDWLGEVPEHWSIRRLKTLFEIKKRIAGEIGYDILSITQNGIKVKDTESNEGQVAMDYAKYQFVYPGDFAMNHMDLLTGYIDISKVEGVTSPDYRVFSIRNVAACHPSYFLRLFQSAYHQKIFYAFGQGASQLGRWRLPTEAFNEFAIPYPTLSEQSQISNFLDRETEKIDALIEQQQHMIRLLKEKRQATISRAVAEGLSRNARLKSSGINRIGNIPEHWAVKKLSHLTTAIGDGLHGTPEYADASDCYFINGNNLCDGKIQISDTTSCVSREQVVGQRIPLNGTSLLLSINGTIGNWALYENEAVMLGKSAAYINCSSKLKREFLSFVLQSSSTNLYSWIKQVGPLSQISPSPQ